MKRFHLSMSEEKHAMLSAKADKMNISMNALINEYIDNIIANDQTYSMQLKFNSSLESVTKILEAQSKRFNELNYWHKIHAELLKDILDIKYQDENINRME